MKYNLKVIANSIRSLMITTEEKCFRGLGTISGDERSLVMLVQMSLTALCPRRVV